MSAEDYFEGRYGTTDYDQLAARILTNAGPQVVDGTADGWAAHCATPGLDSSTAMDRKAGGECSWRETRGRLAQ